VLAEEEGDLGRFMSRLDRIISTNCPTNRFVSLFFCVIDPASGEFVYCNAGHNPPLLLRRGGGIEKLEGGGTILGMLPQLGYEQHGGSLGEGDVLAVYSDGVTEAATPDYEEYGEDRLAEILVANMGADAATMIDAVNRDVLAWTKGAAPFDDITLVVVRRVDLTTATGA
jgi:phosphoserine phosphatase RsbU/P